MILNNLLLKERAIWETHHTKFKKRCLVKDDDFTEHNTHVKTYAHVFIKAWFISEYLLIYLVLMVENT
jgi:hypothetical protein